MTKDRKSSSVKEDQRAMQPGVGGSDGFKPDEGALEPLGDVAAEDDQRDLLRPDIDRPRPDAGDATL